jgi:DNA-binding MarR family transcriptional regulator
MVSAATKSLDMYYPLSLEEWHNTFSKLKPSETKILYFLRSINPFSDRPMPFGVRELAREMSMDHSTVSRGLKRLDLLGHINLESITASIKITPKGRLFDRNNPPVEESNQSQVVPGNTSGAGKHQWCRETPVVPDGTEWCFPASSGVSSHQVVPGNTDRGLEPLHSNSSESLRLNKTIKTLNTLSKSEQKKCEEEKHAIAEEESEQGLMISSEENEVNFQPEISQRSQESEQEFSVQQNQHNQTQSSAAPPQPVENLSGELSLQISPVSSPDKPLSGEQEICLASLPKPNLPSQADFQPAPQPAYLRPPTGAERMEQRFRTGTQLPAYRHKAGNNGYIPEFVEHIRKWLESISKGQPRCKADAIAYIVNKEKTGQQGDLEILNARCEEWQEMEQRTAENQRLREASRAEAMPNVECPVNELPAPRTTFCNQGPKGDNHAAYSDASLVGIPIDAPRELGQADHIARLTAKAAIEALRGQAIAEAKKMGIDLSLIGVNPGKELAPPPAPPVASPPPVGAQGPVPLQPTKISPVAQPNSTHGQRGAGNFLADLLANFSPTQTVPILDPPDGLDIGDLLTSINTLIKRLGWTKERAIARIGIKAQRFDCLDDQQLMQLENELKSTIAKGEL